VIVPRLCIPLFAFKLIVVLRAGVGVRRALAAEGVEIGVVTNNSGVGGYHARGAERVFDVVDGIGTSGEHGNELAAEKDKFGSGVAGGIGFGEDFAAGAVPVELTVGLGDAAAVAVIKIIYAVGRFQLAFAVPDVSVKTIGLRVTRGIVREAGQVIISVGGFGKAGFVGAAGVLGAASGDGLQVGPGIEGVGFRPAMAGAGRKSGSGLRGANCYSPLEAVSAFGSASISTGVPIATSL